MVVRTTIALVLLGLTTGCASQEPNFETEGARILGSLSSTETDAIKDKHIDTAELQRAAVVVSECVKANGFNVQTDGVADRPSDVGVEFPSGTTKIADANQLIVDACFAEVNAIEEVWILQNQPSDGDVRRGHESFVSCIIGAGLDIANKTRFEDAVVAYSEAVNRLGPDAPEFVPLQTCANELSVTQGTTALPGLADALAALNF